MSPTTSPLPPDAPEQLELPTDPTPWLRPEFGPVTERIRSREHRITFPETDLFHGSLRGYQHDGVAMMYLTPRLILGDVTGAGKTVQSLRYLAELKRRGELSSRRPAVVVVTATSLDSTWVKDGFDVFMPGGRGAQRPLRLVSLTGEVSPRDRRRCYATQYAEVILLSYHILIRDWDHMREAYPDGFACHVFDEGSVFKSHTARTAHVVKQMGSTTPRTTVLTATPVQTQLLDLHSILEALQLGRVFGSQKYFHDRYYNMVVKTWKAPGGQYRSARVRSEALPYVNMQELVAKVRPYYFRRNYNDIGADMPELSFSNRWVDMHPDQRRVYDEVRNRVLPPVGPGRRFQLQMRLRYLKEIATSLQTFVPDAPDRSTKLDWLCQRLQGDWSSGGYDGGPVKVVVYSSAKLTIVTLMRRLEALGIGGVVMAGPGDAPGGVPFPWGMPPSKREPFRQRFFEDPTCQVLVGTSAIEMSLNFPVAPVMVNLDLPTNPARLTQLAGRIWRQNSRYRYVHVINLLATHSVELGILRVLQDRQSVIDQMNGEPESMFTHLSDDDLEAITTRNW